MEYLLDYNIGKLYEFISKRKYATYCVIMDVKKKSVARCTKCSLQHNVLFLAHVVVHHTHSLLQIEILVTQGKLIQECTPLS